MNARCDEVGFPRLEAYIAVVLMAAGFFTIYLITSDVWG